MCTVLLPPGVNPTAVKYIMSYIFSPTSVSVILFKTENTAYLTDVFYCHAIRDHTKYISQLISTTRYQFPFTNKTDTVRKLQWNVRTEVFWHLELQAEPLQCGMDNSYGGTSNVTQYLIIPSHAVQQVTSHPKYHSVTLMHTSLKNSSAEIRPPSVPHAFFVLFFCFCSCWRPLCYKLFQFFVPYIHITF
jgi:hypothetical protein